MIIIRKIHFLADNKAIYA